MNIVFFGSSKYSTIDEQALFDAFGLSLIVTTLDHVDTKTKQPTPNLVKKFAIEHKIPVITADKITPEIIEEIGRYHPDFIVSADIRLILPHALLTLPTKAAINVHHSLLPKFRGPAPVPFTILSGETTTGVSIITIAEKVDAGDILAQEIYEITPDDTTDSVLTRLNQLGGPLAVKVIQDFDEYYKNRKQQNEQEATYSHYMTRADGFIDLAKLDSMSELEMRNLKLEIARKVRAYFPWPGVWTLLRLKATEGQAQKEVRVKLLPASSVIPDSDPGSKKIDSRLRGNDKFLIQVEGKKPVSYSDFVHGYPEGKALLEKLQLLR